MPHRAMQENARSTPEHGPWSAELTSTGELVLHSADFDHDAMLRVSGDFGSTEAKLTYGRFLAEVLSTGCKTARALAALPAEGELLTALMDAPGDQAVPLLRRAAQEVARLQVALLEAETRLEQLEAPAYFRRQTQEARTPTTFGEALLKALAPKIL